MLRCCQSSFRILPGYGAKYASFTCSRTHPRASSQAASFSDYGSSSNDNANAIPCTWTASRRHSIRSNTLAQPGNEHQDSVRSESTISCKHSAEIARHKQGVVAPETGIFNPVAEDSEFLLGPCASSSSKNNAVQSVNSSASAYDTIIPSATSPSSFLRGTARKLLPPVTAVGHQRHVILDTPRPTSNREETHSSTDTAVLLIRCLSPEALRTTVFDQKLIDNLVSLYEALRAESRLSCLSTRHLEDLVTICGTYSIPRNSGPSAFHKYPVADDQKISESRRKVYWDFIFQVQHEKHTLLGQELSLADQYWRLRVLLHRVWNERDCSTEELNDSLSEATAQYMEVSHKCSDTGLHLSYFRTVFSVGQKRNALQAADLFCHFLETLDSPSRECADLLWRIIITFGKDLPRRLKDRFLHVVSSRLFAVGSSRRVPERRENSRFLNVNDLSMILASTIFPCYQSGLRPILAQWALSLAQQAFAEEVPVEVRWENLLLLAMNMIHGTAFHPIVVAQENSNPGSTTWRAVLFLGLFKTALKGVDTTPASMHSIRSDLRTVTHPLWQTWAALDASESPIDVQRVAVAGFLEVATLSQDGPLVESCFRLCQERQLWLWDDNAPSSTRLQALGTIATYVRAAAVSEGFRWDAVFSHVASLLPGKLWQQDVVSIVIRLLLPDEVSTAHSLYDFAASHGFEPSGEAILALAIALGQDRHWHVVFPFLSDPRLSNGQIERLLISILRIFQVGKSECINPLLASNLGAAISKLYETFPPSPNAKYPVRWFLKLLIEAGECEMAVDVIASLFKHDPDFFTQRCIRRYIPQIVRRRHPREAIRLFSICQCRFPAPGVGDLRRKLMLALESTQATGLASTFMNKPVDEAKPSGPLKLKSKPTKPWKTTRERMVRISIAQKSPRHRLASLRIMSLMNKHDTTSISYGPTVRYAASFLVKAGRLFAARKLLSRTSPHLDAKTKTAIGNIILHGCFRKANHRNARLIRDLTRTKEFLVEHHGFVCDRATLNIVVKAILDWRSKVDSRQIKSLFDDLIRQGYPASRRWRHQDDVPFGTPQSSNPWSPALPSVSQPFSFTRHVQPLYKMFIKAFFLRNEISAAKTVIGILKEERFADVKEREKRNQARRLGIIRKKARLHGSTDASM